MNEVLKTIGARYSCRSFTDEKPSDEQLMAIANAALAAPSGRNFQRWRVVVVKDKALIDEMDAIGIKFLSENEPEGYDRIMSRGGKMLYNAPTMIMIPVEATDDVMSKIDCGIVAENVALAAESLGLASVICLMARTVFVGDRADEFKKRLKFPEGYEFGICVLIGHAKVKGEPHKPDAEKLIIVE